MDENERSVSQMHELAAGHSVPPAVPVSLRTSQHETLFRDLLDAAPDAIVIVDMAGRIVIVNSQAERVFGYQRDELAGQPIEILLPESLRDVHRHHRASYTAAPHTRPMGSGLDLAARRKDGSALPVEISLSAIQSEDGPLF